MKLNRKSLVELWIGCDTASIVVRITICIKTLLTLPKGEKKSHSEFHTVQTKLTGYSPTK